MSRLNPAKAYHPAGILLFGLVIAQIIATIEVYLSNLELHSTVSALYDAGYLTVPNAMVMSGLQNFWPAFWGDYFSPAASGPASPSAAWQPGGFGLTCSGATSLFYLFFYPSGADSC